MSKDLFDGQGEQGRRKTHLIISDQDFLYVLKLN